MLAISPSCGFEVERGPDWLLVRVKNLDQNEPGVPLADHLWDIAERHFTYRLVVELDEVERLDDALIGQLVDLSQRLEQRDGLLRICGLSAKNRQVLQSRRLNEPLPMYEDRQEAVMGRPHFRRPR